MLDSRYIALLFALVEILVETYPELLPELERLTSEYKSNYFNSALVNPSITNALNRAGLYNVY